MTSTLELHSEPQPIVIPGGGLVEAEGTFVLSPRTIERVEALGRIPSLREMALMTFILCSGGASRYDVAGGLSPGLREGHQMAKWLHENLGIPYAHLEVNDTPENTIENFANAIEGGWLQPHNVIPTTVLTQEGHVSRVELIAGALDLRITPVSVGNLGASSIDEVSLNVHRQYLEGAKGVVAVKAAMPKIRDEMQERFKMSKAA